MTLALFLPVLHHCSHISKFQEVSFLQTGTIVSPRPPLKNYQISNPSWMECYALNHCMILFEFLISCLYFTGVVLAVWSFTEIVLRPTFCKQFFSYKACLFQEITALTFKERNKCHDVTNVMKCLEIQHCDSKIFRTHKCSLYLSSILGKLVGLCFCTINI